MPAANDLPYFPFHVDDYLNDPAVMGMAADSEGCYIRLLARSWRSPTPGRIPIDLMPEMAGLHRVKPARSVVVIRQLRVAFEAGDAEWVQRRMVAEHRRADSAVNARRKGGRNRWKVNKFQADLKLTSSPARGNVDLDLDSPYGTQRSNAAPCLNGSGGVSAACLSRCRVRFPALDLPVIEAKLLAYHAKNPYRNLDLAMLNWCKKAEQRGIDLMPADDQTEWRP